MSDSFQIQTVTGASPVWTLGVDSSIGVQVGAHVLASLDAAEPTGAVYRVTAVPDSLSVEVTDDLLDSPYGQPVTGSAFYYTPTDNLKLSQIPKDALLWDTPLRRDMVVLDEFARGALKIDDPGVGFTQAELDAYKTFVIGASYEAEKGKVTSGNSEPFNLSAFSDWGFSVDTDLGTQSFTISAAAFGTPAAVTASDLANEIDNNLTGVTATTVGGSIQLERNAEGSAFYVEVESYVGAEPDLNSVLNFDGIEHYGVDPVTVELPAPSGADREGLEAMVANMAASAGYIAVEASGLGTVQVLEGAFKIFLWDGSQWLSK